MSEKRVLLIPSDDNELNDFIEEIWDRVNRDTARDFIRSKALPGNLLAEEKTQVYRTRCCPDDFSNFVQVDVGATDLQEEDVVHILILARTDAGSEVKK